MTIKEFDELILSQVLPEESNYAHYGGIPKDHEKAIGIYKRSSVPVNSYGVSSYEVLPLVLLVHWTKSYNQCEMTANRITEALNRYSFDNGWVQAGPSIDIGRDDNEYFEQTIDVTVYVKK